MSILLGLLVAALGWTTVTRALHLADWSFIDYVNLPFHEAGHIFLRGLQALGIVAQCRKSGPLPQLNERRV